MLKYFRFISNLKAIRQCLINIHNFKTKEGQPPITNIEYRKYVRGEVGKISEFLY